MSAYRTILVAVDGSSAATRGLREALRLAKAQGAQLCILQVVNEFDAYAVMEGAGLGADLLATLRDNGRRILAKAHSVAESHAVKTRSVLRQVAGGPVAEVIVREARKLGADLIVLGTHGRRGLRRLVLGSDAEQVVRIAPVPVLLVRAKGASVMSAYRKILVAVDGSAASNKGLTEALRLAKAEGASLRILHVVNDYVVMASMGGVAPPRDLGPLLRESGERILARARALAAKQRLKPVVVLREVLSGPAAESIVREAKKQRADLIVLGTHGRRGLRRLVLGSDAEQVVRTASVPVLLVRA
jgi:nucleotide-binding universal stress UspA family protein